MARLNVLEYAADFIRGWPHGSAVEMNYPSTSNFGNGDIVKIAAGGNVVQATGIAGEVVGIVARGKNDTFNQGGTGTGNLYSQVVPNIVLLSNFVVRTSNVDDANVPTVGANVYINATGNMTSVAGTSVVIGQCLEVETGLTNADGTPVANAITVLVK